MMRTVLDYMTCGWMNSVLSRFVVGKLACLSLSFDDVSIGGVLGMKSPHCHELLFLLFFVFAFWWIMRLPRQELCFLLGRKKD